MSEKISLDSSDLIRKVCLFILMLIPGKNLMQPEC